MGLDPGNGLMMSRNGEITLDWADGTYTFRLGIGELEEHEEAIGKGRPAEYPTGPLAVLGRLWAGTWRIPDVRETIRLGLIGGGMAPAAALNLVRRYVDERPLIPNVGLSVLILSAALGIEEQKRDEPGKAAPASKRRRAGKGKTASTSEASTAPAP